MSVPVDEGLRADAAVPTDLVTAIESVVRGRRQTVELAVGAVLAGGHVLLEDVPGSGKTTLARALSAVIGGTFRRIQGTADLLPTDLTGSAVWDAVRSAFTFVPGPVFANVVLVDELNRVPPRTQSALLEAMDEGAVTVDGVRHALPDPFVVVATQNPHEQWGTYPLPEGQLDRFAVKLSLGLNPESVERQVVRDQLAGATVGALAPVLSADDVARLRARCRDVHVADTVLAYAVALTAATRTHDAVALGGSTRATLALLRCAQARALMRGSNHVRPDDVKALAEPVLTHRLGLHAGTAAADSAAAAASVVRAAVAATPVPLAGA